MQPTRPLGTHPALPFVRWGARILSVPILLFWGWFLIAHLVGDAARPSRPLVPSDTVLLAAVVVSLVGLAVAWKWELLGGTLTLAAVAVGGFINWQVLVFPYALIWVAALLFLACGWLSRARRNDPAARPH
jgi:hypothetical protein